MNRFFFIIPLLLSCDSKKGEDICCVIIDATMHFMVQNTDGTDLLNPGVGEIDVNSIKIWYRLKNGELQEVNNPNLTVSKGYTIITPESKSSRFYEVVIHLSTQQHKDNISYTYIQWAENDMDEVKTQFDRSHGNMLAEKIWINQDFVWQRGLEPLITLIK
ncbi:MAG: hypothetical protein OXC67_00175 [Flavobacteriaceae bacterium]|nr:hypothetical protein [Flavobacteriaceae bacterium]MCY4298097.1 hypothetical protein [Flavobacteriaceae bacterium]